MSVEMVDPIKVRAWEKGWIKQIIIQSVWESFSNRNTETYQVANAGDKKVPTTAIHYVSGLGDGAEYATIPTMDKLVKEGVGGSQAAEGTEETVKLRFARVYYNLRRKAVTFKDDSVDGDLTKAYQIENQKVPLLKDYFAELNDLDKNKAMTVGADQYLTEDKYWTGDSITSAPVKKALHPNVLYAGGTALVTWSATPATYMDNLITAVNTAFTDATTTMDKAVLDRMINWGMYNLAHLGGDYKFIILLSKLQGQQLTSDTDASGWLDTYTNAAERSGSNKAITGVIGMYKKVLICVNERSPLLNCETVAGGYTGTWDERFQYVTPWNKAGGTGLFAGDQRVPIVKGSGDGTRGTCETAMIIGKGAIGGSKVKALNFKSKGMDYDFSKGFLGFQKEGCVRLDVFDPKLYSAGVSSEKPLNWSSALYFTPTDSSVQ